MEIKKCANAISSYKAQAFEAQSKDIQKAKNASKNVDKVEFSSVKLNSSTQMKTAIAQNVESSTSPERISSLKNLISNGQYNISAESIASAIYEI